MKSILGLLLGAVALISLAGCGEHAKDRVAEARVDYAAQNYQQARSALFSILEDSPKDRDALTLLAETQIALGDADGADRAIARLEGAGASGAAVRGLKASVLLLRGRAAEALALVVNDLDTHAWHVRAQAQSALGNDKAAAAAFEKGMAAGDHLPLAVDYARYAFQAEDLGLAERILARMQGFAPKAYNTLVLAGDLAAARGQTDRAIKAYRAAIAAYPDKVAPMLALATVYDEKGLIDHATAVVEQAGKVAAGDPAVEAMRIQLLSEKGEWETIRLAMQSRESSLDPSSSLGLTYGEALLRLGHAEQARILFSRAALLLPGNSYVRMMLGEAQLAGGDPRGAWSTLKPFATGTLAREELLVSAEKAARAAGDGAADDLKARLAPERLKATLALVEKGEAALAGGNWSLALATYRELLKRGEDPEVLKRLALASVRLGRGGDAIAYADRARSLAPGHPDYLYMAGFVRLELGRDVAKARHLLEAAATADPRNPDIARVLEKAKAAAG